MNGLRLPSVMPNASLPRHPTIAVIDIGTNTVLLLVATISSDGSITPLVYEQRIPRLGKGVDEKKRLHADSMYRTVDVLLEYRGIILQHSPDRISVIGTSAVRDAENRDEFIALVRARTGFTLEVLSGRDEAMWTYRGAISGIRTVERATVIDIGGGSTEITSGSSDHIIGSSSIDIGSVRLTERILHHNPPLDEEIRQVRKAIEDHLATVQSVPERGSILVAVAGTATTIALLARGYSEFSLAGVSGVTLTVAEIASTTEELTHMTVEDILAHGSYMQGRADVITAGALILLAVMQRYDFREVVVSERGVRYGIALREGMEQEKRNAETRGVGDVRRRD